MDITNVHAYYMQTLFLESFKQKRVRSCGGGESQVLGKGRGRMVTQKINENWPCSLGTECQLIVVRENWKPECASKCNCVSFCPRKRQGWLNRNISPSNLLCANQNTFYLVICWAKLSTEWVRPVQVTETLMLKVYNQIVHKFLMYRITTLLISNHWPCWLGWWEL